MVTHKTKCRICDGSNLTKFLDLGIMPPANGFMQKSKLDSPEPMYPLVVDFCGDCGLVQLEDVVQKEVLFRDYIYFSSVTDTIPQHFAQQAEEVTERFASKDSLVVEIGSNDGVLLKALKKYGVKPLGVEPATNLAKFANSIGLETINNFFSEELAHEIAQKRRKARIIIGNNVVGHIDDLHDLVRGVNTLLEDDGVFILEVPYLVDLIEKKEYDTIYHEHLSYFSIRSLMELFGQFNMQIFDVKRFLNIHGGSIRVYVRKINGVCRHPAKMVSLLALEKRMKLDSVETYLEFAAQIASNKKRLLSLLNKLKADGKSIVGYGAPAKGNVLLNYCKIGTETLDYIIDSTQAKQGLYTPGMHIPVLAPEKFREDCLDYALMLAWNFEEEILKKEFRYREGGGKFIIPIPDPRIV